MPANCLKDGNSLKSTQEITTESEMFKPAAVGKNSPAGINESAVT